MKRTKLVILWALLAMAIGTAWAGQPVEPKVRYVDFLYGAPWNDGETPLTAVPSIGYAIETVGGIGPLEVRLVPFDHPGHWWFEEYSQADYVIGDLTIVGEGIAKTPYPHEASGMIYEATGTLTVQGARLVYAFAGEAVVLRDSQAWQAVAPQALADRSIVGIVEAYDGSLFVTDSVVHGAMVACHADNCRETRAHVRGNLVTGWLYANALDGGMLRVVANGNQASDDIVHLEIYGDTRVLGPVWAP